MLYLDQGRTSLGGAYLSKIKEPDADALNATGVVAMRNGDWQAADMCFWKAGNAEAAQNRIAMDILRGDYALAAKDAEGVKGVNAATAYILSGSLDKASAALEGVDGARADYARAVIAARQGRSDEARRLLAAAITADPSLKKQADSDIEFAALAI